MNELKLKDKLQAGDTFSYSPALWFNEPIPVAWEGLPVNIFQCLQLKYLRFYRKNTVVTITKLSDSIETIYNEACEVYRKAHFAEWVLTAHDEARATKYKFASRLAGLVAVYHHAVLTTLNTVVPAKPLSTVPDKHLPLGQALYEWSHQDSPDGYLAWDKLFPVVQKVWAERELHVSQTAVKLNSLEH